MKKKDSWSLMDINYFSKEKKLDPYASLQDTESSAIVSYVNRFHKVCRIESEKFGIPAELILANAILMSQAGTNVVSVQSNNQFGLNCFEGLTTQDFKYDGICYKAYDTAWLSFRDFSMVAKKLKTSSKSDLQLKEWLQLLEKELFSDIKNYEDNILKIIDQYQLEFIAA